MYSSHIKVFDLKLIMKAYFVVVGDGYGNK